MIRARSTSLALLIVLAFCGGLTACAGDTSNVGLKRIDDMEGTTGQIEWTPPAGSIPGSWGSSVWNNHEGTQCDHIFPIPGYAGGTWSYEPVPAPYQTLAGVTSTMAARLRTTAPIVNEFGASMGFDFAIIPDSGNRGGNPAPAGCPPGILNPLARPVDLSPYKGITFWARATAGTARVTVAMDDRNTDSRGGVCDATTPDSDQKSCLNSFRISLDLTSTFARYTVYFSQLTQGNFGYRSTPSVLERDKVYSLGFGVETPGGACPPSVVCVGASQPTLTFDLWIDDLYFVNE